jgi:hypothetical protein
MNVKDVEEALILLKSDDPEDFRAWDEWYGDKPIQTEIDNVPVTVTLIEDVGGEGQGDHRHLVFKIERASCLPRFFRKDGYYSSYNGNDWDGDFKEVSPITKTVTVYE